MHQGADVPGNELVMRIQPDEALYLKTFSKEPGLAQVVKPTVMDMKYATQFEGAYVGDAYERCASTTYEQSSSVIGQRYNSIVVAGCS